MNLSLYIAKRYLLSKKSHNAINVISGVSVCGVALATLALVCTLSVFNGFQELVAGFFTAFDPELKITSVHGKTFDSKDSLINHIRQLPEVEVSSFSIEENAMVQYKNRQAVVTIKGVEDNFKQLTQIDSILYGYGNFILYDEIVDYGIFGIQLTSTLGTGIRPIDPIEVYAPKRNIQVNMANPTSSFEQRYLFSPGVVFAVNQEKYDASYVLTSLNFARELFGYSTESTSLELKLKDEANVTSVQSKIQKILGDDFLVQNQYEQQADVFRIMEIEKLISYLFLTFILLVACFNIIGSLSMLIIDKKEDVRTLRNLGADDRFYAICSDGMGSGEEAKQTSEFACNFLKSSLGIGSPETAMHLLNNTLLGKGGECSATVDIFALDTLDGSATFIKSGAAPSFVKRDSSIFRIKSSTAPIGLMKSIDSERIRVEIKGGDYVIMLSDGVSEIAEESPWLLELLTKPAEQTPKAYAEHILTEAKKHSRSHDDMSVIVVKIIKRSSATKE